MSNSNEHKNHYIVYFHHSKVTDHIINIYVRLKNNSGYVSERHLTPFFFWGVGGLLCFLNSVAKFYRNKSLT